MAEPSVIAGIDINNEEVQICIYDDEAGEVKSAPVGASSQKCIFPARLLYFPRTEKWRFGTEADFFASQKDGVMISDILALTEKQEEVFVGPGQNLTTAEVMAELLRQTLAVAGVKNPPVQLRSLCVTVPEVTVNLVKILKEAFAQLLIADKAFFQSYDESYYTRALAVKPDTFRNKAGMFLFDRENHVSFQVLTLSRQTKPATATVEEAGKLTLPDVTEEKDSALLDFAKEMMGNELYTAIYLVGQGFERKWAPFSIAWLCQQGRRVFHGDNLYAGGACYAAKERISAKKALDGYLFLGSDVLLQNVGLDLLKDGKPVYVPLITAGSHWYEAGGSCEFIADTPGKVEIRVDSLEKNSRTDRIMELEGFPDRPPKASRLKITAAYDRPGECTLTVEDMGFGELFPATGRKWTETL